MTTLTTFLTTLTTYGIKNIIHQTYHRRTIGVFYFDGLCYISKMDGSTYNFLPCTNNEIKKTSTMPYFLKLGQTQESCAAMNPRSTPLSAVTPPTSTQHQPDMALCMTPIFKPLPLPNSSDPFFLLGLNPANPCTSTRWRRFMRPAPRERCSPACLPSNMCFHV